MTVYCFGRLHEDRLAILHGNVASTSFGLCSCMLLCAWLRISVVMLLMYTYQLPLGQYGYIHQPAIGLTIAAASHAAYIYIASLMLCLYVGKALLDHTSCVMIMSSCTAMADGQHFCSI